MKQETIVGVAACTWLAGATVWMILIVSLVVVGIGILWLRCAGSGRII